MYFRITMIFIMIAIAGCASKNVGHSPESFSSFKSESCFILQKPFFYQEKRGLGYLWDQGLRKGEYKAKYQDNNGYYYVGPENAVCQAQEKCDDFGKWPGGEGGVWISKNLENDIRLFVISDINKFRDKYTEESLGPILNLLVDMDTDDGKFFIFDKNQEFVDFIILKKTTCQVVE